jgi:hypothetical protein
MLTGHQENRVGKYHCPVQCRVSDVPNIVAPSHRKSCVLTTQKLQLVNQRITRGSYSIFMLRDLIKLHPNCGTMTRRCDVPTDTDLARSGGYFCHELSSSLTL